MYTVAPAGQDGDHVFRVSKGLAGASRKVHMSRPIKHWLRGQHAAASTPSVAIIHHFLRYRPTRNVSLRTPTWSGQRCGGRILQSMLTVSNQHKNKASISTETCTVIADRSGLAVLYTLFQQKSPLQFSENLVSSQPIAKFFYHYKKMAFSRSIFHRRLYSYPVKCKNLWFIKFETTLL